MKCHFASRVWFGSKLGVNFNNIHTSFIEWLTHAINSLNEDDISYVAAITYSLWFARNQQVFDLRCMEDEHVINRANLSIQEYQSTLAYETANLSTQHQHQTTSSSTPNRCSNANKRWTRPNNGVIKVNCDANLTIEGSWGLGAIYRDSEGATLAAATWVVPGSKDPTLAETCALYKAILLALDCGFYDVDCESDNATVISFVNNVSSSPRSYVGNFVQGILCNRVRFRRIAFRPISRKANTVAHSLAGLAHIEPNRVWIENAHPSIVPLLIRDLIH
jgi:hypothetical protein